MISTRTSRSKGGSVDPGGPPYGDWPALPFSFWIPLKYFPFFNFLHDPLFPSFSSTRHFSTTYELSLSALITPERLGNYFDKQTHFFCPLPSHPITFLLFYHSFYLATTRFMTLS